MPGRIIVENCDKCTANWANFRHLSKSEMQLINENRYEAFFKTGEMMVKQGSPATHAMFMANGLAKVYIEGQGGKNFMLGLAMPGNLIMSPGAYFRSSHTYSVAAISQSRACFVSIDIIRQIVKNNGLFGESLVDDLSRKAFRSHLRMVSMAQKRMSGRLAEILLYLADEVFRSDEYEMVLSRQELGEMATMAKECVVRILKEFEDSKIINSNSSKISIIDKEKLKLISEKG